MSRNLLKINFIHLKFGLENAGCQDTTSENILFWWCVIFLFHYADAIQEATR